MQALFIPSLTNVADECIKYITWHGYNKSVYDNNSMGTRRVSLFSTNLHMVSLMGHLDNSPQTVLGSELEQVSDPKQVRHFPEDEGNSSKIESPQSSTVPSNIHIVDKPQTVLVSELEQVVDPKQVEHVSEDEVNSPKMDTPQSSTLPSNIHMVATFFKHVL